MKVLWLCNIVLPQIASKLGYTVEVCGGWLTGLAKEIEKADSIELAVCAPFMCNKKYNKIWNSVSFYGFHNSKACTEYNGLLEYEFKEIIKDFNPDIVHIFGTEYPHSLAMVSAFSQPERTIINIQGLVSICAKHYSSGLPYNIQRRYTFRDFVRQDNILQQIKKMKKRGIIEKKAIRGVNHVVGRTDWDRACVQIINPKINYHYCNEILRESFYTGQWSLKDCNKNSIFISQAGYPIKGLHFILEALPEIVKRYPKTHLYIAGGIDLNKDSFKSRIRIPMYEQYLRKLIKEKNLKRNITYLNSLDEYSMYKQYLKANVYVSASTIENESNSISEAKILGVPVVASYAGGVTSRITHGVDGMLYQHDAPYMLVKYVCDIFSDDKLAINLSANARVNANMVNDPIKNASNMKSIYKKVFNTDSKVSGIYK